MLRAALEGRDPDDVVAVVATAGATNNGAVDDLAAVAGVCAEAGVWLHVDGAYGGAALLSPRTRGLFAGIERADSFIVNPHKWLYLPFDCAAVVYRDERGARQALTQEADYLDVIADEEAGNPSDLAVHLTRRARGLPLWASVLAYGTDAYVQAIEHCLDMAAYAAERIAASDALELVLEPSLTRRRLPPPRLEPCRLRRLERRGPAQRPRHGHPHEARRRDGPAPLLHQPADDAGRRRPDRRRPREGATVTEEPLVGRHHGDGHVRGRRHQGRARGRRHPRRHPRRAAFELALRRLGRRLGLVQVLVEADRLDEARAVLAELERVERIAGDVRRRRGRSRRTQ